jgi:signal transduction histidine kinase
MPAENKSYSARLPFAVEARLLQELGERLVASPEVAILELIKNSRDADAVECRVALFSGAQGTSLTIVDNGFGMSFHDFENHWMRIATGNKKDPTTKVYGRPVTGQKGIGRFAIRYLGSALRLVSVSVNRKTGKKQMLEALFDWRKLDKHLNLGEAKVPYRVTDRDDSEPTGTRLIVFRLKPGLAEAVNKSFLTDVLRLVQPVNALETGKFAQAAVGKATIDEASEASVEDPQSGTGKRDPGFTVRFSGFPTISEEDGDLPRKIIDAAWARLKVSLNGNAVNYTVRFRDGFENTFHCTFPNIISQGLFADIAFAPKRKNAFLGAGVDRREVWTWIRKNSGVGIIDKGFRIRPYGFNDDDWLYLNQDGVYNRRDWRSPISENHFPLSELEKVRPALSAALNLASNYQLIGQVCVDSRSPNDVLKEDLTPATDREGFLNNKAYEQLVDVVRGGLEFLAKVDKARLLEDLAREAEEAKEQLRDDLEGAVDQIANDPNLGEREKNALIKHYSQFTARLEDQEDYDRAARQRLEIAAGLGVVAGFMTHEAERLFSALDSVISRLSKLVTKNPAFAADLDNIKGARSQLDGYIQYTRLYTDSLRDGQIQSFSALGQIEWVREHFEAIGSGRGIKTEVDCADDVMVPPVPVALYSGVLLNLYSNAIKAVTARTNLSVAPRILISGWNDAKNHYLSVQDSGIGIPPSLQNRIWDPFFTTTSQTNSSYGSGMGLGLSLVKDLVGRVGGKVQLDEASPGYVTCFKVSLPRGNHGD